MQLLEIIQAALRGTTAAGQRELADLHERAVWALGLSDAELQAEVDAAMRQAAAAREAGQLDC